MSTPPPNTLAIHVASLHRELEGSPVAAETSLAGLLTRGAINALGWERIRGYVKLTGGTSPSVDLEMYEVQAPDGGTDEWVDTGEAASSLENKQSFAFDVHERRVAFAVGAVTGNPTKVQIFIQGAKRAR